MPDDGTAGPRPVLAKDVSAVVVVATALVGLVILLTFMVAANDATANDIPANDATANDIPANGATGNGGRADVEVEVFWGDGCRFCEELLVLLEELAEELDGFVVVDREVWFDTANQRLMAQRADELGVRSGSVPLTVVDGTEVWVGYTPSIGRQIETTIRALVSDPGGAPTTPSPEPETVVTLPLFGDIDVQGRSLLLATVLIAFVDGFNPCSLWVLTVLLGLVLHTGSRQRVLAIGGSFLLVTTAAYGLFIVGVFGALSVVGSLSWIRLVVAAFALGFGIVNVKDYFWYKRGLSFTIPDDAKPGLYRRARGLVRPDLGLPAAMVGAGVMAAGVALIEIPCTAGFPVIWSELVRSAGSSGLAFAGLLGVYLGVYLLDELVVFGAAVVTMRSSKLQEHHGRGLKLVGGVLMIAIALTMVAVPELMEQPTGVLGVFALAVATSGLIMLATRSTRGEHGEGRPPHRMGAGPDRGPDS